VANFREMSPRVDLAPIVKELQASGATSLRAIAKGLNDRGIATARGGQWTAVQVMRVLSRIEGKHPFVDGTDSLAA
jgi:hypothetical protein